MTENIKYFECEYIDSSEFDGNGECEEYYKHIPTGKEFVLTLNLDDAREHAEWRELEKKEYIKTDKQLNISLYMIKPLDFSRVFFYL